MIFQEIFDLPVTGIVDKATWYSIKRRYIAVKRLCELISEGLTISEAERLFPENLQEGDTSAGVRVIQYFLAFLGYFDENLPQISITGTFDAATTNAVRQFQSQRGLTVTGIVDRTVWGEILSAYNALLSNLPEEYQQYASLIYPGYFLTEGEDSLAVTTLQNAINEIAAVDPSVPTLEVTGIYDDATMEAVKVLQLQAGFEPNGAVGPLMWRYIMDRSVASS